MWQVPQGWPVWRAKLGSACASGANPIVSKADAAATNATAASSLKLPKGRVIQPTSPHIARYPVVCSTPVQTHDLNQKLLTGMTIVHEWKRR